MVFTTYPLKYGGADGLDPVRSEIVHAHPGQPAAEGDPAVAAECRRRSTGFAPSAIGLRKSRGLQQARAWREGLVMSLQWYDERANNPPWIDARAELRQADRPIHGVGAKVPLSSPSE